VIASMGVVLGLLSIKVMVINPYQLFVSVQLGTCEQEETFASSTDMQDEQQGGRSLEGCRSF
jgi:hypothetical protein